METVDIVKLAGIFGVAEWALCMTCSPIGLLSLAMAIAHFKKRTHKLRRAALVLVTITLAGGMLGLAITGFGFVQGQRRAEHAVSGLDDPHDRAVLLEKVNNEARMAALFGCATSGLPMFFALCALGVALPRRD